MLEPQTLAQQESHADDSAAHPPAPGAPRSTLDVLFQGIECGPFRIAVSYRWARAIVDSYDEIPVPKAPLWLAGAAAIEGQVRPIVDIALLADPTFVRPHTARAMSVLVGGREDGDLTDPPLALLFDGTPQQLRADDESATALFAPPPALAPLVTRRITSTRGDTYYVVDMVKLADQLAAELSTL